MSSWSYRAWPKSSVHKEEKLCSQTSGHHLEEWEKLAAQVAHGERKDVNGALVLAVVSLHEALSPWQVRGLTRFMSFLHCIRTEPALTYRRSLNHTEYCVNIPWPKIKWVKIQDRFRNVPIYSWKLRVSVWMQRAQRLHFPSLNTDALAQGHEVAYSEPASCHSNQQLMLQEALLEAHCSSHVGTQGSSDTHRTGEGSMVKG